MRSPSVHALGQQVSRAEAVMQSRCFAGQERLLGPLPGQLIQVPVDVSQQMWIWGRESFVTSLYCLDCLGLLVSPFHMCLVRSR